MRKTTAIALCAAFVAGGLMAALAATVRLADFYRAGATAHPVWTEVAWPFASDQWGKGKAFECRASDCGAQVRLYVRAKIGFCNCTTGVSDDDELERISDFDIMGGQAARLDNGHPITVAWMKGRSRAYAIGDHGGWTALSLGLNEHCDAIVATTVIGHNRPAAIEPAVIAFLGGETIISWAGATLGL